MTYLFVPAQIICFRFRFRFRLRYFILSFGEHPSRDNTREHIQLT